MNEEQPQQPVAGEGRPFADRVTEMSRQELQRRVLTQRDYIARYQRCIDGLGLSGPDGHRLPGDITAAVREMWLAEGAAADSAKAPIADKTAFAAAPGWASALRRAATALHHRIAQTTERLQNDTTINEEVAAALEDCVQNDHAALIEVQRALRSPIGPDSAESATRRIEGKP